MLAGICTRCSEDERSEVIEEGLEHAGLAQPVEPFPYALPIAGTLQQRLPGDVVD